MLFSHDYRIRVGSSRKNTTKSTVKGLSELNNKKKERKQRIEKIKGKSKHVRSKVHTSSGLSLVQPTVCYLNTKGQKLLEQDQNESNG